MVDVIDQLEKAGKLGLISEVKKINFPAILLIKLHKNMLETQLLRIFPELAQIRNSIIIPSFMENYGLQPENTYSICDLLQYCSEEDRKEGLVLKNSIREADMLTFDKVINGFHEKRKRQKKILQQLPRLKIVIFEQNT